MADALVENYSVSVFNSLPEFEEARNHAKEVSVINEMLAIIESAGLGELLGVSLLHNHFQLQVDEFLVERLVDNKFVSVPSKEIGIYFPFLPSPRELLKFIP